MKLNRTYFFIALSSVALLIVLIIQVNLLFQTAKIKEEIFNEKAAMVLSKTAEALSSDTLTRRNIEVCVGKNEVHKIDSLFNHYMKIYNVQIAYYFEVKKGSVFNTNQPGSIYSSTPNEGCYQMCLGTPPVINGCGVPNRNGMDLKLVFPEKEEYILEEMGIPFITSVLLILLVLVMSWRTTFSLMKEKQISEHTTDFLNNMTHEFKTPLTNIALAGKMMVKDANIRVEDKVKHYSGIILEENEKLRLQVEQVLSMTALERGEIPLQKTELDLHQMIHECLKHIGIQIENKHGNLKLKLDADRFVVMGDKIHLTNALCNLIDNAIKYSPESPELLIKTYNSGHNLMLVVSDTGMGIEEKYHGKIFDKFFRVPTGDVHDVKGFGLGLAYVKKIVDLHSGHIELQSEQGKGTIFTIILPYV